MTDIARLGLEVTTGRSDERIRRLDSNLDRVRKTGSRVQGVVSQLGITFAAGMGLRKIIQESSESQRVMDQLEAVIASTGGVAGKSVAELDAMAGALQKTTRFGDEATKSAQALLLTFKRIRGEEFDRATMVTLDLATAMGSDLKSAALQVGKALEDPATQMTALRRSGVSFTEAQVEMAREMQRTGDIAGAQALVLRELEAQFGGSAEAARNNLGGALAYLRNQFDDFFEVSEDGSRVFIEAINAMGDAIPRVRETIEAFFGGIQILAIESAVAIGHIDVALARVGETAAGSAARGVLRFFDQFGQNLDDSAGGLLGSGEGAGLLDPFGLDLFDAAVEKLSTSSEDAEQNLQNLRDAADEMIASILGAGDGASRLAAGLQEADSAAEELKEELVDIEALNKAAAEELAWIRTAQAIDEATRARREYQDELEEQTVSFAEWTLENIERERRARAEAAEEAQEAMLRQREVARLIGAAFVDTWDDIHREGLAAFDDLAARVVDIFVTAGHEISDELGAVLAGIGGVGIGASSGSIVQGLVGGGASGFAVAGPVGAIAGAVGGIVGGLVESGRRAREAARQWQLAFEDFENLFEDLSPLERNLRALDRAFRELSAGRSIEELRAELKDMRRQAAAGSQQLRDFLAPTIEQLEALIAIYEEKEKRARELAKAEKEAAKATEDLTEKIRQSFDDLALRGLEALGRTDEAARLRLQIRQRQDRADLVDESLRELMNLVHMLERDMLERRQAAEAQIAEIQEAAQEEMDRLDELIRVESEALRLTEGQIRVQEQQVAELQRVTDTLRAFQNELTLSGLSPLSPIDRLGEARSQFAETLLAAQGGDLSAASDLPRLARALLEASRDVNASGRGFVLDFQMVQEALDALAGQTEGQLSIEEQTLDELVRQSEEIEAQIDVLTSTREEITRQAEAQIEAIRDGLSAVEDSLGAKLDELIRQGRMIEIHSDGDTGQERILTLNRDGFQATVDGLNGVRRTLEETNQILRRRTSEEYV